MDIRTTTNSYRLLWAGFFAIFASGVGFAVRSRVLTYWAADYGFTMAELGGITGGGLTGFGVIILLGSFIADRIGYGKLMVFAFIMHLLSAVLQLCTDQIYTMFGDNGRSAVYWSLYIAMFLFAIGNGTCEVVVNPVVATLFPEKKTHYLNILHAGWPGGLITGGVIAYFMNGGGIGDWVPLGNVHWLIQMSLFLVPVAIYGLMMFGVEFPKSEAGQAGVGYFTMLLQVLSPVFLLLLLIHALVGYVELGTDSWISLITGKIMDSPNKGLLLFIYTSGLMFVLRFFGGPLEHRMSPLGLLCLSGVLGAVGLTLLSQAEGVIICVIAATVYALGKTFLWPTMLAVASERFPKGGAITIGMVGGVGMLSAGLLGGPGIGFQQDYYATENLKTEQIGTYERYKTKDVNTFLTFHVQGVDGSKRNILELATKLDNLNVDINDPKTAADKKPALEAEAKSIKKEIDAALDKEKLTDWWLPPTQGMPTDKQKVLELSAKLEKIKQEVKDEATPAAKKTALEDQHKELKKELHNALQANPDLEKWFQALGEPHKNTDIKPVEAASLYGGRMALLMTAAVPATMAILYLLLIVYFRARGGYTKEVVVHKPGDAAATAAWMERIGGPVAEAPEEHVRRPDTDIK